MEVVFYKNKFRTMTNGLGNDMLSRVVAVAVDLGVKGEGYVAYFADVDDIFNQKYLAKCIYDAKVPFYDVLGMTYSEIVKQQKTGQKTPLKQRIARIDDFIAKCKYKNEILNDQDRQSIGILYNNRPLIVAKAVDDTLAEYKDVVDYSKHPKLAKLKITTTKTLLARDFYYNRIAFLQDSDFVGPWSLIEEELQEKIGACLKNKKFDEVEDEAKAELKRTAGNIK